MNGQTEMITTVRDLVGKTIESIELKPPETWAENGELEVRFSDGTEAIFYAYPVHGDNAEIALLDC